MIIIGGLAQGVRRGTGVVQLPSGRFDFNGFRRLARFPAREESLNLMSGLVLNGHENQGQNRGEQKPPRP